mmetsp:Transcript_59458/g.184553  ORF Transcript_59458/g.184553 Transcript_59458/m.184553 type:complete len:202 (+) Transcript_59458:602-1207(+)
MPRCERLERACDVHPGLLRARSGRGGRRCSRGRRARGRRRGPSDGGRRPRGLRGHGGQPRRRRRGRRGWAPGGGRGGGHSRPGRDRLVRRAAAEVRRVVVHGPPPGAGEARRSRGACLARERPPAQQLGVVHAADLHAGVEPVQERQRAAALSGRPPLKVDHLLPHDRLLAGWTQHVRPLLLNPLVEAVGAEHVRTGQHQR